MLHIERRTDRLFSQSGGFCSIHQVTHKYDTPLALAKLHLAIPWEIEQVIYLVVLQTTRYIFINMKRNSCCTFNILLVFIITVSGS